MEAASPHAPFVMPRRFSLARKRSRVNEKEISADVSAATLKAHLARHALPADIVRMDADRADIQPTILSIAADTGLDLIVMGGYGHSRLGERILGGVTRGMLKSMTVPTLMSH